VSRDGATAKALEGRVLCHDVRAADGNVALEKGQALDAALAARLLGLPWQEVHLLELEPGATPAAVEAVLAQVPLAADERLELAGPTRELVRSFGQLRLALVLSLVLVFLTIAALYESLALPLAVMVTVPVAVAGALLALAATGGGLDVLSFLGLILLAGIVVNNAIVLVHRVEQLRAAPRLVLRAPPGAGKTTRVPAALLDAGLAEGRQVVVLEPRRIAARAPRYTLFKLMAITASQLSGRGTV